MQDLTERERRKLAAQLPACRWDRWILVARLISAGFTQKQAARAADVGERTVRRWTKDPRWPKAIAEAAVLWSSGSILEARRSLLARLRAGDVTLAMWLGEKLDPTLQKPQINREMASGVQVFIVGEQTGLNAHPPHPEGHGAPPPY